MELPTRGRNPPSCRCPEAIELATQDSTDAITLIRAISTSSLTIIVPDYHWIYCQTTVNYSFTYVIEESQARSKKAMASLYAVFGR